MTLPPLLVKILETLLRTVPDDSHRDICNLALVR